MSISWNTGAAAMRFRHNLKLKNKKRPPARKLQAASAKLQASSFKRHEKDTIKMYKQLRKGEIMQTEKTKTVSNPGFDDKQFTKKNMWIVGSTGLRTLASYATMTGTSL